MFGEMCWNLWVWRGLGLSEISVFWLCIIMHLMAVSVAVSGVWGFGLIRAGVDMGLENLLVGMLCNGWNLWVLPKSGVEGFFGVLG